MSSAEYRKHRSKNDNIKIAKFTQTSEDGSSFNVRVCGSQGVFYTINFHDSFGAQCSCPDFTIRKRNCKHIYFVIGTVAKDEGLFFAINDKPNFTIDELQAMCAHIKEQVNVMYNSHEKKDVEKEKVVIERDDGCPICQCDLEPSDNLWKCQICKHVMHAQCLSSWWAIDYSNKECCAYCRSKNHRVDDGSSNDPWSIFQSLVG